MPRLSRSEVQPHSVPTLPPIRWCLLLFVFCLPYENISYGNYANEFTYIKLIGMILAAAAIMQPWVCFARPPKAFWFFLAYLAVYATRGVLQSDIASRTIASILSIAQCLIFFWIVYNILSHDDSAWMSLATVLIVSNTLVVVAIFLGLASPGSASGFEGDRETAFQQNQNTLGFYFVMAFLSAVALILHKKLPLVLRLSLIPISLVLAAKCMTTGSRGSMLSIAVAMLVYMLGTKGFARKFKSVFVVGMFAVVLGYVLLNTEIARERWNLTIEKGDVAGRNRIIDISLEMFCEKPILGWGPTTHLVELADRENEGRPIRDTHNDILWALTCTGLVGGIPFVLGLGACFIAAWKGRTKPGGTLALMLMSALLTDSMSGTLHIQKNFWVIAALACASGAASTSRTLRTTPQPMRLARRNGS